MNLNEIEEAIHKHMEATADGEDALTYMAPNILVRRPFPVAIGVSLSIQASPSHYCSPRKILGVGERYERVEVYCGETPIAFLSEEDSVASVTVRELAVAIKATEGSW